MSFGKSMKCYLCCTHRPLEDEKFPEDLYDLIVHYNIDQLLWICKSCKNDPDRKKTLSNSHQLNNLKEMEDFAVLKEKVRLFTEDVNSLITENMNGPMCRTLTIVENDRYRRNYLENCSEDMEDSGNDSGSLLSCSSLSVSDTPKEKKGSLKYIHSILNEIKISREEEAVGKKVINSFLDILLNNMKKDEEFSSMFNKLFYTGSAYNDLRITSATEYDIDLVLRVPSNIKLTPEFFDETCAFTKLKWKAENVNSNISSPAMKFFLLNSHEGYLEPQMVLSWLQRHVDLTLKQNITYPDVLNAKSGSSGPAITIIIDTSLGYSISIDLVPVFEFECSVLHGTSVFDEVKKTSEDPNRNKWFVVPKQTKGEIDLLVSELKFCWRLDFPYAEKHVLQGKECAKSVIKILKIFRDKQNWKNLASYHLKMVVILEINKNSSREFWTNRYTFERTLDAFKQLKIYFENQNLPHFLTKQNLLFKFKKVHFTNWCNYLNRLILSVESDPEKLLTILESSTLGPIYKL